MRIVKIRNENAQPEMVLIIRDNVIMKWNKKFIERITNITKGCKLYFGSGVGTSRGLIPTARCLLGADEVTFSKVCDLAYLYEDTSYVTHTIILYKTSIALKNKSFNWMKVENGIVCEE